LPKVKMDFGIGDLKVADQSSKKERFPVHASVQTGYVGDGWIRVRRLINPQFLQIKGEPNRVEIKFLEADRVTLEPRIHIPLDLASQGLINQISEDKDNDQEDGEDSADPNK